MSAALGPATELGPPPVTPEQQRRLRTTGLLAGALVGASTAWLVGGGAVWALMIGSAAVMGFLIELFIPLGPAPTPLQRLLEPWLLWPILLGVLAGPVGWLVSWMRLRRWGVGRALGVTAAASVLVALTGLAVGVGVFVLVLAFIGDSAFLIEQIAPIVGGVVGAGLGALVGWGTWVWMGGLIRPRR